MHLGQLDLNGSLGRLYGGVGLAIDRPQIELVVKRAQGLEVEAAEAERSRVADVAKQYISHYHLAGARIRVNRTIPAHSGLGSSTQLALAIGFALTRVYGLQTPLMELAQITDREGSRSGIGVAAFEHGGLIVDGGMARSDTEKGWKARTKTGDQGGIRPPSGIRSGEGCEVGAETARTDSPSYQAPKVPPVIARLPFPQDWGIILAIPQAQEKMAGAKEVEAFNSLAPMSEQVAGQISRLVLMQLLPALAEKDLTLFGRAVTAIQELVGSYFAPAQGGVFATQAGERWAEYLLSRGAAGVGQSSWGPTVYGFIERERLMPLVREMRELVGKRGVVLPARGVNHGARWGWGEAQLIDLWSGKAHALRQQILEAGLAENL